MPTDTITIEQFISKHNLKFECKRVESRSDGLMGDAQMRHFRCKVHTPELPKGKEYVSLNECLPRSFSVYFSQGSAHTAAPTLADVLDCLASDANGYEDAKQSGVTNSIGRPNAFMDWCEEYGYDTDSRKAEKTFKAIKRQSEQMKRTLGADAYEELLYNTERM